MIPLMMTFQMSKHVGFAAYVTSVYVVINNTLNQGWTNPERQVAMAPRKFALAPRILEAVIGIKMFFCYFENVGLTITAFSNVHLKNVSRNHG
jgi:hypothetical protein